MSCASFHFSTELLLLVIDAEATLQLLQSIAFKMLEITFWFTQVVLERPDHPELFRDLGEELSLIIAWGGVVSFHNSYVRSDTLFHNQSLTGRS